MFFDTLLDNRELFRDAFAETITLSITVGVLCFVAGILLAAMRVSPVPVLRAVAAVYVAVLRNTPLTLVFVFVFFGFPKLGVSASPFKVAIIALSVYTAAFVCEAVLSGINTVASGQAEAARAIGMTFGQTLRLIVLPQALRAVTPPLISTMIAMTKNTTIAAGFSVAEAGRIRAVLTEPNPATGVVYDQLNILIWVALCFVVILVPLSILQQRLERRWRVTR